VHLAAQVGIGQSMYEIVKYVDHNSLGTAVLLAAVAARKPAIKRLVVAKSEQSRAALLEQPRSLSRRA
jgi:dTDP-L-rhamnose 4-epimerase